MMRLLWIGVIVALWLGTARLSRADVSPWNDPRLRPWAAAFVQGRHVEVLAAVERDLLSSKPHPFASHVWVMTHEARDTLGTAIAALDKQPKLKSALGALPEVYAKFLAGRSRELLDQFPPSRTAQLGEPWTLHYLVRAADARPLDSLAYAEQRLALSPDLGAARDYWMAVARLGGDPAVLDRARALVAKRPIAGTPFEPFLKALLHRDVTHVDRLTAIAAVVRVVSDPEAWAFQAEALSSIRRYSEMAALYERADALYPWIDRTPGRVRALLRLGKRDEAERVLVRGARRYGTKLAHARRVTHELVSALRDIGELGQAKAAIDAALKKWPDDASLHHELYLYWPAPANLEHARRAAEHDPSIARRVTLVRALVHANRLALARALYDQLAAQGDTSAGDLLYERLKLHDERIRWHEARVREEPQDARRRLDLADAFADGGRKPEAIQSILAAYATIEPTSESISALVEYHGADGTAVDKLLAELRTRHPGNRDLAVAIAARFGGADATAKRLALYEQASRDAPDRYWPWERRVATLVEQQRWEEAAKVAEAARAASSAWPVGQRVASLLAAPFVTYRRARVAPASTIAVEQALARVREYEQANGLPDEVLDYRYELLGAIGRKLEACEVLVQHANVAPDREEVWRKLALECREEARGRDKVAAGRFLDRRPDDGARLLAVARASVELWGGPVKALGHIHRLKRVAPATDASIYEAMAYGHLGDGTKQFSIGYLRATSVAPSDRYIHWYELARKAAQRSSSNVVTFDEQTRSATIQYPNGDSIVRRDHPLSGSPVEIRRGATTVRAWYDPTGTRLARLEAGKTAIVFTLDARKMPLKTAFFVAGYEVESLSYEYDQNGKMSLIRITGPDPKMRGEIRVSWLPNGEIDKQVTKGGHRVVQRIRQLFEQLEEAYRSLERSAVGPPRIPFPDFETRLLQYELENQRARAIGAPESRKDVERKQVLVREIALARHLVSRAADSVQYYETAYTMIQELHATSTSERGRVELAVTAAGLFHQLLQKARPHGAKAQELRHLAELDAWLRTLAEETTRPESKQAAAMLRAFEADPIKILESERALPNTEYANPRMWSKIEISSIVPDAGRGAVPRATLVRTNGDLVVGTSRGLLVRTAGSWRWLGFDPHVGRFSTMAPASGIDGASDIGALAETRQGLWVGTAAGLYVLSGDYTGVVKRPSRAPIRSIAAAGDAVVVVTPDGAMSATTDRTAAIAGLPAGPVMAVAASQKDIHIATASGVFALSNGVSTRTGLAVRPDTTAIALVGTTLWTLAGGKLWARGVQRMSTRELASKRITALGELTIDDEPAVVVAADRMLWFDRGSHFEQFVVPGAVAADITHVQDGMGVTLLATPSALHVWDRTGEFPLGGPVDELLTLPAARTTLVVNNGALWTIDHADPSAEPFELPVKMRVAHVQRAPGGVDVIVSDDQKVARLNLATGKLVELFAMSPAPSKLDSRGARSSLLVASDGTVWATRLGSVFRHKNGKTEEYSYFVDPAKFPSRSQMISRVVETVDRRIWVVASSEPHLRHDHAVLDGGLLELVGDRFRRIENPGERWFVNSYTSISATEGIVGTTAGFAVHDGKRLSDPYTDHENPTYRAIIDQHRGMHLGSRGARLAADTWLFGTPSGVVMYVRGADRTRDRWQLLEGVNALLPDSWLLARGGRHVHAVETDPAGRIYVGTDRGLVVLSGLAEVAAHDANAHVFDAAARTALARDRDAIGDIPSLSAAAGKIIAGERVLAELVARRRPGVAVDLGSTPPSAAERTQLDARIATERGVIRAARDELRTTKPALAQLFDEPAAPAALAATLAADQVLVRYRATPTKLLIEVIERDRTSRRVVTVDGAQLQSRASRAAWRIDAGGQGDNKFQQSIRVAVANHAQAPLDLELAWLYDQMLRPIEPLLAGKQHVDVVAHDALRYLPLGALVRTRSPRIEYAAERFVFRYHGVEPTSTTARPLASRPGPAAVIDGKTTALPAMGAARGLVLRVGQLDPVAPQRTGLAPGGARVRLAELARFPLEGARLVVLQGWMAPGRDGGELSATVRALAIAGTQATLFAPHDSLSVEVMQRVFDQNEDPAAAVTATQRAAIRSGQSPTRWGGLRLYASGYRASVPHRL